MSSITTATETRSGWVDPETASPGTAGGSVNDLHTVVIARKIRLGREADYERWVGKVATALHGTPGYDGMTAISSPDPQGTVRTLLIRFRSADALYAWEGSAMRRSLEKEGNLFSAAYYREAPGLEAFFSVPRMSSGPALWKMCLLTTPTVFVLFNATLFAVLRVVPSAKDWPNGIRMALVIAIVVVLLTYVCLPFLSKIFAPWLFSRATPPTIRTVAPTSPGGGPGGSVTKV